MKKTLAILAMAFAASAMAQFTSQKAANQVAQGDTAIVIENVAGKPGTAIFKTSGLVMVVLNDEAQPTGMKVDASKPDTSDSAKTANIASFKSNGAMATSNKLCWRGVGPQGWHQMACAKVKADGTAKHQVVMSARGETFAMTPELQSTKGEHVAWVSHPGQVRQQLHCDGKSQQASLFHVDSNGVIRPATPAEVEAFDKGEYARICKA